MDREMDDYEEEIQAEYDKQQILEEVERLQEEADRNEKEISEDYGIG
jgi:hypothetical protein